MDADDTPWTADQRAKIASWLRLEFTCSAIGRAFGGLSKKETVRRIVADTELSRLRPTLKGLNPQQRRHIPRQKLNEPPPVRNFVNETPLKPRRAAPIDPMMVVHKADLAHADDPPLPPMTVLPISGMRLVALPDLERGECRWPVADNPDVVGKVLFCGKATKPGQSYCKAHTFAALPARQREGVRLGQAK